MLTEEPLLDRHLLTMRIILGAMLMGPLVAMAIFVGMRAQANQPVADVPMMSYVFAAVTVVALAVSLVVPNRVVASARRMLAQPDRSASSRRFGNEPVADTIGFWCVLYQTRLIVGSALLEGPASAWLVAYFIEGTPWSLLAAAALLGLLASKFPTRLGLENWIEDQRELLQRERSAG
jgi:hypothetical protein